jgi:hypothetical protein
MQLFVDQLRADGDYRGAHGASWVHPLMPTAVLTGAGFLDGGGGETCWLYHVEGGRFITADTLAETAVVAMDTLVVVAGDLRFADPAFIDRMWQRAGGPTRRVAHAGMPPGERAALAAYAQ